MSKLHELTMSNSIDFANRMIYNKERIPVFNFGKYSGRSVVEVLKSDPSYYDWILKGDFAIDTKKKLTEIKLQGFQR
jgi:DNA polymerase-3 subunit epsilon